MTVVIICQCSDSMKGSLPPSPSPGSPCDTNPKEVTLTDATPASTTNNGEANASKASKEANSEPPADDTDDLADDAQTKGKREEEKQRLI